MAKPNPLAQHWKAQALQMHERLLKSEETTQRVVNGILSDMEDQVVARLAKAKTLTSVQSQRYTDMLAAVREIVTGAYDEAARVVQSAQVGVIVAEREGLAGSVKQIVGVDLLGTEVNMDFIESLARNTMVQGAIASDWLAKQASDAVDSFEQMVKLGMASNETTAQIITRVMGDEEVGGAFDLTRAQTAALVQTSIAESANDARVDMFKANADVLDGFEQVSEMDDHTTEICQEYNGAQWDLDGNPLNDDDPPFNDGPPRHWNCRSTLIPIVKSLAELA